MAEETKKLSTKSAGIVGLAVMCSRLLGLLRELILAALFGASRNMDAFITAFRAPNLLRDLFAEGALSTAFITTFSKKIANEGDAAAWRLASKMATLTLVFMSFVTLVGILLSGPLIHLLSPGFDAEKAALTVMLTRIMFPFILLVSLAALVMGILNAKNVFGVPAMASSFFNIGSIIGSVVLGWLFDHHFGARSLIGLSLGTLLGGLLQLVVQFPPLKKVGYRFHFDFNWNDDGVRTVLKLMIPAVIAASAVQVNVFVNTGFASLLGDGAQASLNYAFRLMQLPLGLFGVAIGTVTLPLISRSAAAKNMVEFRSILARSNRLVLLLTVPSAIGLALLAEPIISLIFQRGRFDQVALVRTADALRFYALGLVGYSGIKVLAPAFYAVDKRNTPMIVSFFAIAINYFLNKYLTFQLGWGISGLAFSTGLVAMINFIALYTFMSRHLKGLETPFLLLTIGKLAIAGGAMGAVCWASQKWLFSDLAHMHFLPKLIAVAVTISVAGVLFFAAAYFLKIDEVEDVMKIVKRKLNRGAAK